MAYSRSRLQRTLDDFFPTVVRYAGLVLMVVLVVGSVLGSIDFPAGFVAATGMILYKTVRSAGNDDGGE